MAEHPLLPLPRPNTTKLPPGPRDLTSLRLPTKAIQIGKFDPVFNRLREVLSRQGAAQLQTDPQGLAPDRVIVFEVAGTVRNFLRAVSRITGFHFMGELEKEFLPDEQFAVQDDREGKEGQGRADKPVPGRLYLTMPDARALKELLRLWERWKKTGKLDRNFAAFAHLFEQLHDLRLWGPQDRIPAETLAFWREELSLHPGQSVRTELELWYRDSEFLRQKASKRVLSIVSEASGRIVDEKTIKNIAYHGMLVDIPASQIQNLMTDRSVKLALMDEVMFFQPQGQFRSPLQIEAEADETLKAVGPRPIAGQPVAALLDGMPMQAHTLLDGRLVLDDPDDIQSRAVVAHRVHGTAMASLILHGDLNENGPQLSRPLYVRPLMLTSNGGQEHTDPDRLLIDTIYRAVLRIKGGLEEAGVAPNIFLVNLSIGDIRRPFTGLMSPLARLLDFLSVRYNILFLVSGGNVASPLDIPEFTGWTGFENAAPQDRQRAVLKALNATKYERTMLSPAESLNALTIGAQHHDQVENRVGLSGVADPLEDHTLPNVSSGLGLGHRSMVKPELYFPAGREHVRMQRAGEVLTVTVASPRRLYGLSAAAPDTAGAGRIDQVALCDGTSSATALATRAAHRIFEALVDQEGGSLLADIAPQFYPVVVKTLLVHSARWNENAELLKEICGPADKKRHVERAENAARFIGFGVPDPEQALECAFNRATLVGYGTLRPNTAHKFRIPLPPCLERVTEPRSLTVTLAWFSPISPGHRSYRSVRLEADQLDPPLQAFGVERRKTQPADQTVKRGSVFHEEYEGESAVPFIDDGHLSLRVWCKEDAGHDHEVAVKYGIAITIEAGPALPIYEQIQQRLGLAVRLHP